MARTHGAIGTTEVIDRLVMLKQCPVTSGRPTRMTAAAFKKVCQHHQKNEAAYNGDAKKQRSAPTWCSICQGKQRPVELEILSIGTINAPSTTQKKDKESDMPSMRKKGKCGSCGTKDVIVGASYGGMKCSSCLTVYSNVNRRLETVVAAIKHFGVIGTVIDALGGGCSSSPSDGAPSGSDQTGEIVKVLAEKGYPITNIPADIAHLVDTVERLQDDLSRLRQEYAAVAEQASEAEQRYLAGEQVFAALRDILGVDNAGNEDLPTVVRTRLQDQGGNAGRSSAARYAELDSHLLDLLVEFPGIGVDRIAVIREAV